MKLDAPQQGGALLLRARAHARKVLPVTVVIPAFERRELLVRALESVAAQDGAQPAEVIVVDDCSSDGTGDAARRLGAHVIRHEENRGEGAARNTAIEAASQPWIAQLDSDDEWLPNALAELWRLREGHVLVSGSHLCIGPAGECIRFGGTTRRRPEVISSPARLLFPENSASASSTLLRRDAVVAAGGYRPLPLCADLDLWVRVLEHGSGVVSPAVVAIYHLHGHQATGDHPATRAAHEQVARSYEGRPWWSAALVDQVRAVSAWDGLRQGLRAGRRREAIGDAAFIARSPRRVLAVARTCARRLAFKARRRAATNRRIARSASL
jgi:glycosyltransferase involved in cell wall biosynthesis